MHTYSLKHPDTGAESPDGRGLEPRVEVLVDTREVERVEEGHDSEEADDVGQANAVADVHDHWPCVVRVTRGADQRDGRLESDEQGQAHRRHAHLAVAQQVLHLFEQRVAHDNDNSALNRSQSSHKGVN